VSEYVRYGNLFRFLMLRDLGLRYRQTALGFLWALLQPLAPMLIFAVVFTRLLHPQTGGVPYWLYSLAGLALWSFFANAVAFAGGAFLGSRELLNKVYFPRAILPWAAVTSFILDLMIGMAAILIGTLAAGFPPRAAWLLLPVIALATFGMTLAVGLAIASLSVQFRDVKHAIPFLLQIWMFATPIFYPPALFPERMRWAIGFNPMAGAVEAFRGCLFGLEVDWHAIGASCAMAVLIVIAAGALFRQVEDDLAERT
jgi:lipopolysaccharide transport system permease protein